ncbi:MAG TPA: hypothetical protein PKW76_01385 [bacterium]|nr:hypothetical protein [bacterium]HPM96674.1 hypothetical protein [bacterium]
MGSCGGGASFLGRKSGGLRDLAPLHLGKTRNLEWKPALRTAIPASASWRDRGSQGKRVFFKVQSSADFFVGVIAVRYQLHAGPKCQRAPGRRGIDVGWQ